MMESPSPSPQNKSVQGAGRRGRGFPELRHKQLKEQAVAFYSEHKVQDALEGLLNEMFLSDPRDVYGYMSDYFRGLSKDPVISSLSVYEELDSSGEKALNLELYCTVRGKDKLVSNTSLSLEMYDLSVEAQPVPPPPKSPRGTPRNKSPRSRASRGGTPSRKTPVKSNLDPGELTSSHASTASSVPTSVLSAAKTVNDYISPAVKGLSPFLQNEVDTTLAAITTEDGSLHPSALLAASYAAGIAGARLTNTPLYLHLAKTCRPPSPSSQPDTTFKRAPGEACRFTMPLPVVGVLSGGQSGCGKCKFREFCLSPLPGAPFPEQIQMIVAVHKELGKCLTGKYGGSGQGRLLSGSYCPTLDKPEQGLDFIRDAARNAGFELNQGMGVIVDVGADTLYNEEKGKYELIAGQWKSSDDVITIYANLLRSYPGLLGYVDPLHHTDVDGWKKLQERLGDNCLLIADQTLKKGLPISEQKPETILTDTPDDTNPVVLPDKPSVNYLSCGALTLEATISQTLAKATHIKGHSYYVMLRVPPNSTVSTLPADMAVAMMCRFLRMGGPNGLTSCGLLSRLLRIREELVSKKLHDPAGALVFTSMPPGVDTVYE